MTTSSQDGLDCAAVTAIPKHLSYFTSWKFLTRTTTRLIWNFRGLCSPLLVWIQAHRRFLSIRASIVIVTASSTSAQLWHMLLSFTFHLLSWVTCPHLPLKNCYSTCAQKVEIQKYLVNSTSDDLPVIIEIVTLTLECALHGNAQSNANLCKDSVQKIFSFCILL